MGRLNYREARKSPDSFLVFRKMSAVVLSRITFSLSYSFPQQKNGVRCKFRHSLQPEIAGIRISNQKMGQSASIRCSASERMSYSRFPCEDGVSEKSIWSRLGQRLNFAGIASTLKVIVVERSLALPHVKVPDIRWINWKELREQGIKGVVFDKDNTITAPYATCIWPAIADSLEGCKSIFEGQVVLLSNSAGLYQYDPDGSEAKALEEKIGIPVIRHGNKKPFGTAKDIEKYFSCDSSQLVMIGDRYFTDVVYGNRNGFLTILTEPLTLAGESFVVRQVRKLENVFVDRFMQRGIKPKDHHLLLNSHDFTQRPK